MDELNIPPKIKEDILEYLEIAEYALFCVQYLLKKLVDKRKRLD